MQLNKFGGKQVKVESGIMQGLQFAFINFIFNGKF